MSTPSSWQKIMPKVRGYMHQDYYNHQAGPPLQCNTPTKVVNMRPSLAAYGRGDPMGYGSYYQNCGHVHRNNSKAAMAHMAANQLVNSPLNHHLSNARSPRGLAPASSVGPSLASKSPWQIITHPEANSGVGSGSSGVRKRYWGWILGYHSPQQGQHQGSGVGAQSQDHGNIVVPQPQLTPGGNDGISSDNSDDEGSPGKCPQSSYPWMKKIHVSGLGKFFMKIFPKNFWFCFVVL